MSVGLSHYPPGATGELDAASTEIIYIVTVGVLDVDFEGDTCTLGVGDSVYIEAGEKRCAVNRSGHDAELLVIRRWD